MRKDAARMMTLKRHGWEVYYYTAEQVFGHPEVVVRDVRDALVRRAPHLLVSAVRRARRRPGHLHR
jgi:very-short-patch-repair endonuclease